MVPTLTRLFKPCANGLPRMVGPRQSGALRLFLLFQLVLLTSHVSAQDLIVRQDKTSIEAKVLEVTDEDIRYKKFDFQDGPIYSIKIADVFIIVYKSGRTETFGAQTPGQVTQAASPDSVVMVEQNEPIDAPPAPAAPTTPAAVEPAVPATVSPALQPTVADKPQDVVTNTAIKNPLRLMASAGVVGFLQNLAFMGAVELVGANNKIGFLSGISNGGLGLAVNQLADLSWDAEDGERLVYDKYYLTPYAFKEFDGRLGLAGLSLGPTLGYTHATRYGSPRPAQNFESISTGFLTAGLHTGQYVQKYFWKNSLGQKTAFVRLGFNQFLALQGGAGGTFLITIGI